MISILAVLLSLFVIHRVDGRRVKNIHYLSTPSNRTLIRNRVEYIILPLSGQKCGTIPYEKLSDLDKRFLEMFWYEIKNQKVDRMRKTDGLKKFHQINLSCIEKVTAKKKSSNPYTPPPENHTFSPTIPHSVQRMWDMFKEL